MGSDVVVDSSTNTLRSEGRSHPLSYRPVHGHIGVKTTTDEDPVYDQSQGKERFSPTVSVDRYP